MENLTLHEASWTCRDSTPIFFPNIKNKMAQSPRRSTSRRRSNVRSSTRRRSPKRRRRSSKRRKSPPRRRVLSRRYGGGTAKDCEFYACVVKSDRVECSQKGIPNGPVLQRFYTSPVPLPLELAEKEQARIHAVPIEHGIVYLNNKPGSEKTFNYVVNGNAVSFQNTKGNQLFSLLKEYVVVDPTKTLSEDSVGPELLAHRDSSPKKGIASNVLIEHHDTQCIMLFGTSGSGKTTNAGKIIRQFINIQKGIQESATVILESVKVLYGQAEVKRQGNTRKLIFHDVGIHDFKTLLFKTAISEGNWTGASLGNMGVIPLVQETLQTMKRGAFKVDKKLPNRTYVNLVSQTTNTVSSRCLVAYTIKVGMKTLILFDAPGNENAADIIHSMFSVLDSSINDDELVDLILSSKLSHVNGNLQGSLPVEGVVESGKEVLAYHDARDPVQLHMKREVEKHKSDQRGNVGGQTHNPHAYIPGVETGLTDAMKPGHLEYCKERVRESLYINLLVGKMTETLDMSKANETGVMKQVSPFMTVGVGNTTKTGTTFENPTLFCQGGQCTVQETRALYPAHDTTLGHTTDLTDEEMHQHHMNLKTITNNFLEEVLPIRELQQGCVSNAIRAVIVLPIHSANTQQRDIVQKGVQLMSLQLIGKPSD